MFKAVVVDFTSNMLQPQLPRICLLDLALFAFASRNELLGQQHEVWPRGMTSPRCQLCEDTGPVVYLRRI